MEKTVPRSLKIWFTIHFVVDMIFGIPLLFFPEWFLSFFSLGIKVLGIFNIPTIELVTARLVGAALIGIGGASLLTRNKGVESYDSMLTLKIIWSISALVALLISKPLLWPIIAVFAAFSTIWIYYKRKLN